MYKIQTLILFAERYGSGFLFDFEVPAAALTSVNPIVVLLLGPIVAVAFEKYEASIKRAVSYTHLDVYKRQFAS